MIKIQQKSLVAAKYNRSLHYLYNILFSTNKNIKYKQHKFNTSSPIYSFSVQPNQIFEKKISDPKKKYKKKNHLKFSFKLLPLVSSCNRINILNSFLHRSACYKQNKLTHINHTSSFLKQRQRHKLLCQYTIGWIKIKKLM